MECDRGHGVRGAEEGVQGERYEGEGCEDDTCSWCFGYHQPATSPGSASPSENDLFLCDAPGCGRAFCERCIRSNLGEAQVEAVREAEPWRCLACAPPEAMNRLRKRTG
eukprot:scaffold31402_cov67-Isochrysis_galbana.AAC.1